MTMINPITVCLSHEMRYLIEDASLSDGLFVSTWSRRILINAAKTNRQPLKIDDKRRMLLNDSICIYLSDEMKDLIDNIVLKEGLTVSTWARRILVEAAKENEVAQGIEEEDHNQGRLLC